MASIGTGRPDNSHPHSLSNTRALRRPLTSPPASGPPPSSSLAFLYDSPPIPGDPDYQGEDLDLFVPVRNNRRGRATENTGLGTEIDTERDTTATRTTTTATTTATTALLPVAAAAAVAVGNRNYYSDISSNSTAQPPLPLQTQDESQFPHLSFLPSLPSLQRPRSVGGNRNGIHTPVYNESAATSARTSYTRVDITAMEPSVEESLGQAGHAQGEGAGGGEASSSPPAMSSTNIPNPNATTTTTTTTNEQTQQPEQEINHLNANTQQQLTPSTPIPQTPQVALCFLLISGKRRVMQFEPETTVGRVKELVWNAWPTDWQDERPPTPWHLRLLYLGKILQDDDTLKGLSFPIHTPSSQSDSQTQPQPQEPPPLPTIVHLSIRPFGPGAPTPDDEIKKKRKSIRVPRWGSTVSTGNEGGRDTPLDGTEGGTTGGDVGGRSSSACCGCVVS